MTEAVPTVLEFKASVVVGVPAGGLRATTSVGSA